MVSFDQKSTSSCFIFPASSLNLEAKAPLFFSFFFLNGAMIFIGRWGGGRKRIKGGSDRNYGTQNLIYPSYYLKNSKLMK